MMRRIHAVVLAVLVVVTLSPARAEANAVAAPTISAPATVRYWTPFRVTGTALPGGTAVNIYSQRVGHPVHLAASVVSDASGAYAMTATIDTTYSYYAVANGARSAVVTSQIKTVACSTSGPAVGRLPFASYDTPAQNPSFPYFQAFVAFTANRLGTWAGVAYDGGNEFAIVTWRSGQPLHVLDRFAYTTTSFDTVAGYGSVAVAGILPNGGIVASVQPTTAGFTFPGPRIGYVYQSGHRYRLRGSPNWVMTHPVGVTSAGAIVGWVDAYDVHHHLHHAVVRWVSATAAPTTVVSTGLDYAYPVTDRHGDIAYYTAGLSKVVLASGQTRTLGALPGSLNYAASVGDGGSTIYGKSDTAGGYAIVAWPLASPPATGAIPPHQLTGAGVDTQPMAVGPHGQVLNGYAVPTRMRTPSGGYPRLPAILPVDTGMNPGESVDSFGAVAFTSRTDGLVHFLRCQ
jgi:hypothetical protein